LKKFVIFSDSLSSLQAIDGFNIDNAQAQQVYFTKYFINISVLSLQDNTDITPKDILLTEQMLHFVNITLHWMSEVRPSSP